MTAPTQQLTAIHAMLAAGHRNLWVERHTLWLWGIPPGVLFALSESILTQEHFPVVTERAFAWLGLITSVLLTIAVTDWHLTRKIKASRDEAWSFIHRQVIKVQWLIMGMAALATFASFFYGGGYMICAVWLVFLGLSLYMHGLFSEELLEWIGALCILIGVASLFAGLPYETMRWVVAAVFGFGLPLLAFMLDRGRHRSAPIRLLQMLAWLTAVLIVPICLEQRANRLDIPDIKPMTLQAFVAQAPSIGEVVVALPAGTRIPVEIEVGGDLFASSGEKPVLPLTLDRPIELLLRDGQLTGDVRVAGEPWQQSRQARWISIPWLKAELSSTRGPVVTGSLIVQLHPH